MFSLGLDIGSSSVKACLYDAETLRVVGSSTSPTDEMAISSPKSGWAEQDPELWWHHVLECCGELRRNYPTDWADIRAVGVAYQMHGLVVLDKAGKPVRPSIIWCDSRAVENGSKMTEAIGRKALLDSNLNTPGNFTASKMAWMMENEPDVWSKVAAVMLPGDYIAYRLGGKMSTTRSGLSEMALWDFLNNKIDSLILNHNPIIGDLLPPFLANIGVTETVTDEVASLLGLKKGVVLAYRAGDQPNNAFGLGVTDPGSVAVNAGTSGVVYAVTDKPVVDEAEAFNPFLHVNDQEQHRRIGLLLCLNGCGILNAQMRRLTKTDSYEEMNAQASEIDLGSEGLRILPFGNGAERMLGNKNLGASVIGWDLVRHSDAHFFRASLEGIAAALSYGIDHMRSLGVQISNVHAGRANLFLSPVFCELIASMAQVDLYLYDSDGASAAAKGAAFGANMIDSAKKPSDLLGDPIIFRKKTDQQDEYGHLRASYYDKISSILN